MSAYLGGVQPVRFYLVRHAEAERGGPDAARHLTPAGRDGFAALAGALAGTLGLSRVLSSPAVRARETAEILAASAGAPLAEELALEAGRSTGAALLALGRAAGDGAALVGHNPEMAEAVALASGAAPLVPPGTVAAIAVEPGGFRLLWVRSP